MEGLIIEQANKENIGEGTEVLLEAFLEEGFTSFIFDFSRKNTKKYLYRAFLLRSRLNLEAGERIFLAKTDGKIAGVLFLKKNGKVPPGRLLKIILPGIFRVLPLLGKLRFGNIIPGLKSLKTSREIEEPYLTLEAVGVGKDYQGMGIGKLLLNKAHNIAEADPEIKGIYLFTADLKNKNIYERFGYETIEEVKNRGITAYHMFRKNPEKN